MHKGNNGWGVVEVAGGGGGGRALRGTYSVFKCFRYPNGLYSDPHCAFVTVD